MCKQILQNSQAIIEIKGSKFLAFLEPLNDAKAIKIRQDELKAEHPKAVHVVYASRILNEFGQIVENQSDDGEPKGSSGAPSLNVLRGAKLVNVACFIVRYFGGTLLGVGGLVRAYSDAVNAAILNATLQNYVKKDKYFCDLAYANVRQFNYILDKHNISYQQNFSDIVRIDFELSEQEFDELLPIFTKERFEILKANDA